MNAFANALNDVATISRTENGDVTYNTSNNACVDLFFRLPAMRQRPDADLISLFNIAYKENPDLASRILLWVRDIRSGAGERKIFKTIVQDLEVRHPDRLERILKLVPELGRWDDLFVVKTEKFKNIVLDMFFQALVAKNGLAAKWAPRESSKNKTWAKALREFMGLTEREYRKLIVGLSKTVEQQMCAKEWDEINFSHVPSVANSKYSKAFWKHQNERYGEFVNKATKGEVKINASAIFPYDVLKDSVDNLTRNAMWKQLPDFVPAGVSFIPIVDTSASMTWTKVAPNVMPRDVAESLAVYMAERNSSAFKNLVLEFNSDARWIKLPETDNVMDKVNKIRHSSVGGSTNLDAAMQAILDIAIKNRVSQEDLPKFLIVFSDMEFNAGGSYGGTAKTVAQRTAEAFAAAGYKMPNIVWWNIQSRGNTTPVRFDEKGMALVGGFSPTIAKSVLAGDTDPVKVMLRTVGTERYDH